MINKMKGFTLIETLVAILLLSSAIAGPMTIAARGLYASTIVRNEVTAYYLAQDAMEYIRYARDSNSLTGSDWLSNLGSCTSTDGSASCYIDTIGAVAAACGGPCPTLKYDSTNHYFNYSSGSATPQQFVRIVKITSPGANVSEASVSVSVSWKDLSGMAHPAIVVRENLLNWQ